MWSVWFVSYFNKNIKRVNDEQREVNILSTFASQEYMYIFTIHSAPLDVFYRELSFQFPDRAWRHAQIFWAGLMIHYVDCSSSSFKHMFSYNLKKKIDDIVWKIKSKKTNHIWKWLNRLYSMKLKKKIPGCQYNILYIHLFDVLWKWP